MTHIIVMSLFIALIIGVKYSQNKFGKKLQDPKEWKALVSTYKLSERKQRKLCKKYKLPYFDKMKEKTDS